MSIATPQISDSARPPAPRRWIPLSLRMFVVMLGVLAAWTGVVIYQRQAAIRAIERLGGLVETEPIGPAWLQTLIDPEQWPFQRMVFVSISPSHPIGFTDENLSLLEHFGDLETLSLFGAPVTDSSLGRLRHLTNLKSLDLRWTQITDSGLASVQGFRRLKVIDLRKTAITDAGAAKLQQALPGLTIWR